MKKLILRLVLSALILNITSSAVFAGELSADSNDQKIEQILIKLNQSTNDLKTYQGKIEYLFSQPLFDSQTLRKGDIYYKKHDSASTLRINFHSIKQDQQPAQDIPDHYLFDGVWLTQVNYKLKAVKKHQMTEQDNPIDAFELASRNFPIIGFTRTDQLKKDFKISLQPSESNKLIKLHLTVTPDSYYADDYTTIDFWIDKKIYLPVKITAVSTEEDIYQIELIKPKVNKKLNQDIFKLDYPDEFGEPEIIPLDKQQ